MPFFQAYYSNILYLYLISHFFFFYFKILYYLLIFLSLNFFHTGFGTGVVINVPHNCFSALLSYGSKV